MGTDFSFRRFPEQNADKKKLQSISLDVHKLLNYFKTHCDYFRKLSKTSLHRKSRFLAGISLKKVVKTAGHLKLFNLRPEMLLEMQDIDTENVLHQFSERTIKRFNSVQSGWRDLNYDRQFLIIMCGNCQKKHKTVIFASFSCLHETPLSPAAT